MPSRDVQAVFNELLAVQKEILVELSNIGKSQPTVLVGSYGFTHDNAKLLANMSTTEYSLLDSITIPLLQFKNFANNDGLTYIVDSLLANNLQRIAHDKAHDGSLSKAIELQCELFFRICELAKLDINLTTILLATSADTADKLANLSISQITKIHKVNANLLRVDNAKKSNGLNKLLCAVQDHSEHKLQLSTTLFAA